MNIYRIIILMGFSTMNILTSQNELPCVHDQLNSDSITLFSHGLLDSGRSQISGYTLNEVSPDTQATQPAFLPRHTISKPYAYFNFDDACEPTYGIKLFKFWHLSFGQHNDIEKLFRAYNATVQKFPTRHLVLAGVSRGSSVILSFVAAYQPKNIKALVLESPFDRIQTSLQAAAEHVPSLINFGLTRAVAKFILANIAFKYKIDALQPIDVVYKIPLNMPILIVCSLEDKLVPAYSSYHLYEALRARGHKHAYILVLEKGKHAKLLHGQSGEQYEYVVHAFYKKYGLKHDPSLAEKGEPLLKLCQPNGPLTVRQP